jgi:uncharacterized protein
VPESFASKYGKWAVIAGASEGLGAAFAAELGARGMSLVLLARRAELLAEVKERLGAGKNIEIRTAACDLARADLATVLEALTHDLEVGVAIYNAAYAPVGDVIDHALPDLLRVIDVNVRGPLLFARTLAPAMVKRGRGALLFMSSIAGFQGAPRLSTYAASKAFNTVLGEGLWAELAPHGVDVLVSCAGAIRTPAYEKTSKSEAPGTLDAAQVVQQTLEALGHGPTVVPGATNQFARFLLGRVLPRRTAISLMAKNTKDLT